MDQQNKDKFDNLLDRLHLLHSSQINALENLKILSHSINKKPERIIHDTIPILEKIREERSRSSSLNNENKPTRSHSSHIDDEEEDSKKNAINDAAAIEQQKKAQTAILAREESRTLHQNDFKNFQILVCCAILFALVSIPFRIAFLDNEIEMAYLRYIYNFSDIIIYFIFAIDLYIIHKERVKVRETAIQERMVKKLVSVNETVASRKLFDMYDKDGNGHITKNELLQVMHQMGETRISDFEISKLMDEFDLDQNGTIEFAEFSMVVEHFKARKELMPENEWIRRISFYYSCNIAAVIPWNYLFYIITNFYLIENGIQQYSNFLLISYFLKIFRLYELIYEIEKRIHVINPSIFRLINLIFICFLISHWIGCGWYFISLYEGFGKNDWVSDDKMKNLSITSKYIKSFYWGFISSTGTDNEAPYTNMEIIFSLIVMFIGTSMYATIVGNVGSLLANLDSSAVSFQEKIDSVITYMHYKQLPQTIQTRVLDYYEYLWSRQKGLDESKILDDLPSSMRTDISLFLNREVLEKVPFFQNASENFIKVLVRKLRPVVTAPSEYIIKYGDVGREMYFINRGVVMVCSEDEKHIFTVLSDGNFFGEYALLFSQKRSATVKSLTYCDMFILTQEDFQSVLLDFPEFSIMIRKEGIKRVVDRIPLFKDFTRELKDVVVSLLKPKSVLKGEYIIHKGDPGEEMYFLSQGVAQVLSQDENTVVNNLQDGDFFGEVALLTSRPRTASIRASKNCDLFLITRIDFTEMLASYPKFAKKMRELRRQYSQSSLVHSQVHSHVE